MKFRVLLAMLCVTWTASCSDPSADIEQGKVSRVQTSDIEDENEHKDSLEASTENDLSENLKALMEAEKRRKEEASKAKAEKTGAPADKVSGNTQENTASAKKEPALPPAAEVAQQRSEEYLSIAQVVPGETAFRLASSADFAMADIAAKNKININLTCVGNFPCPVNLRIEKEEWDAIDTTKALAAVVTPAKVTIPAGETGMVTVSVNVGAGSPVMESQHMHLIATSDDPEQKKLYNQEIKFSVKPEMDIYMIGGTVTEDKGEVWSTGQPQVGNRITHQFKAAVKVNVHVMDPSGTSHVMHGAGNIPHQNTGANPTIGDAPYSFTLQPGEAGRIYCHDHETGNLGQDLSVAAAP